MPSKIKNSNQGGKRPGQKYKSLVVWQYLKRRTDEDHAVKSKRIKEYLDTYKIPGDRHSISRDIDELNNLFENPIKDDLPKSEQLRYRIEYDAKLRGYKVSERPYKFEHLRMLAECVNAAKFITDNQANAFKSLISEFCSKYEAKELKNEVYVVGRVKTTNKHIMRYISEIHNAITQHKKISFKYLKYTLQQGAEQVERKHGETYIVSPYQLIINDGNYYLLSYNSQKQDMRTYRVDRMREVAVVDEPREGSEVFQDIDLRTYTRRVFNMFGGSQTRVRIRFTNDMLDTVVDRFGADGEVSYFKYDARHFIVSANIEISDQFYSWICSFRKKATIISPSNVVDGMKKFISDIEARYQYDK